MQNPSFPALSRYWLLLGVEALGVAGLFSLVLVIARTPALAELPFFVKFFHEALVVHVDLSVLVWFLAIACLMMSLLTAPSRPPIFGMEQAALISFGLGTLAIAASPLDGSAQPLMSNYIPVITSPIFFMGLSLLLCGTMLMVARVLLSGKQSEFFTQGERFGVFSSAIITLIAAASFFWSFHLLPEVIEGQQRYELGFWGGGHVLQFTHTQMVMLCWLLLAAALHPGFSPSPRMIISLFAIGLLASFATPLGYIGLDITSMEHREFFTRVMIMGGGIAPAILLLVLLPVLAKTRAARMGAQRALWSSLLMSLLLFGYGGLLGGMIQGQNVVIPAHYHGSIVGVTLAFMGVAYLLLPRFGYREVSSWRTAFWQPIVYGGGQILHISGLAWSGGYGVLRKTPGGMANLSPDVKAALGLMGAGGLLAIIGGLMFVIVVILAVKKPKQAIA
jgi:hypothetical protein